MADGDVSIALDVLPGSMAGITTAAAGFGQLIGSAAVFTKMVTKSTSAADSFAMTMTAGLGLIAVESANAAGEFERAMKVAQVVSNATNRDMEVLKKNVNELSVTYRMSIDKMTDGLQTLGRAGLKSVNTQLEVLNTGLGAAKLSGLELNDVLEKIVQTTSLLGGDIKSTNFGSQVEDVSNKILATSMTAPINMNDVVQTLSFSGGTAAAGGINLEHPDALYDYLGAISAFAQKGVTGSIAGTALRAFFTKPASQDNSVVDALGQIGLNPEDLWEKGGQRMKKVSDQIAIIHKAMDKASMSQLDRIEIWGDIVGAKMGQQMMKLDENTIRDTSKDIKNMASSQELAQKSLQNYASDLEQLKEQALVVWRAIGEGFANILDNKTLGDISSIIKIITRFLEFLSSGTGIFMIRTAIIGIISYITTRIGNLISLFKEMGGLLTNQIKNATSETEKYGKEVSKSANNFVKFGLTSNQAESLSGSTAKVTKNLKTSSDIISEFLIKLNQITEIMREMHLEIEAMNQTGLSSIDEKQYARHFNTKDAQQWTKGSYINKTDYESSRGNLLKPELVRLSKQHGVSYKELEKIYNSRDFRDFAGKKGSTFDKYGFYTASDINAYLKENNIGVKYKENAYKNFIDSINQKITSMSDSMKEVEKSAANVEKSVTKTSSRRDNKTNANGYYDHIDSYGKRQNRTVEFSKGSRSFDSINFEERSQGLSAQFKDYKNKGVSDPAAYAKKFSTEINALYDDFEDKLIAAEREFKGEKLKEVLTEIRDDYNKTFEAMHNNLQNALGSGSSLVKAKLKENYPDEIDSGIIINDIKSSTPFLNHDLNKTNKEIAGLEENKKTRAQQIKEEYEKAIQESEDISDENAKELAQEKAYETMRNKLDKLDIKFKQTLEKLTKDKTSIQNRIDSYHNGVDFDKTSRFENYYVANEKIDSMIDELDKMEQLRNEKYRATDSGFKLYKEVFDAMLDEYEMPKTKIIEKDGKSTEIDLTQEDIEKSFKNKLEADPMYQGRSMLLNAIETNASMVRAGKGNAKARFETPGSFNPAQNKQYENVFRIFLDELYMNDALRNMLDNSQIESIESVRNQFNEGKIPTFTEDSFYKDYMSYMLKTDTEFFEAYARLKRMLNDYDISFSNDLNTVEKNLKKEAETRKKEHQKHTKNIDKLKEKIENLTKQRDNAKSKLDAKKDEITKFGSSESKKEFDVTKITTLGLKDNDNYAALRDILASSKGLTTISKLSDENTFFDKDFKFGKDEKTAMIKALEKKSTNNKVVEEFINKIKANKIKNKNQLQKELSTLLAIIKNDYEESDKNQIKDADKKLKKLQEEHDELLKNLQDKNKKLTTTKNELKESQNYLEKHTLREPEEVINEFGDLKRKLAVAQYNAIDNEALSDLEHADFAKLSQERDDMLTSEYKKFIRSPEGKAIYEVAKQKDEELQNEINKLKNLIQEEINKRGSHEVQVISEWVNQHYKEVEKEIEEQINRAIEIGDATKQLFWEERKKAFEQHKVNEIKAISSLVTESSISQDDVTQPVYGPQEEKTLSSLNEQARAIQAQFEQQTLLEMSTRIKTVDDAILQYCSEEYEMYKSVMDNSNKQALTFGEFMKQNYSKYKRLLDGTGQGLTEYHISKYNEYKARIEKEAGITKESLEKGMEQYHLNEYEMYRKMLKDSNQTMVTFNQFMKENFAKIKYKDGSFSYVERYGYDTPGFANTFGMVMGDPNKSIWDNQELTSKNKLYSRGFGFNLLSGLGLVDERGHIKSSDGTYYEKENYNDLTRKDKFKLFTGRWAQSGMYGHIVSPAIKSLSNLPENATKMQKGMALAGGAFAGLASFYGPLEIAMMGVDAAMQFYAEKQQEYNEKLSDAISNLSEAQTNFEEAEEDFMEAYEKKNKKATQEQKDEAYLNALYTSNDKNDGLDNYRHKLYDKVTLISMNIGKVSKQLEDYWFGAAGAVNQNFWTPLERDIGNLTNVLFNTGAANEYQKTVKNEQDYYKDLFETDKGKNRASWGKRDEFNQAMAGETDSDIARWWFDTGQQLANTQKEISEKHAAASGQMIDDWNDMSRSTQTWIEDIEDFSDQTRYATHLAFEGIDALAPQAHAYRNIFGANGNTESYYAFEQDLMNNNQSKRLRMATALNQMPDYFLKMQRLYFGTKPNKYGKLSLVGDTKKAQTDREDKILTHIAKMVGGITKQQARQLLVLSTISEINQLVKDSIEPQLISQTESAMSAALSGSITAGATQNNWTATEAVNAGVSVISAQLATVVQAKVMEIQGYEASAAGIDLKDVYAVQNADQAGQDISSGKINGLDHTLTQQQIRDARNISAAGYKGYYQAFMSQLPGMDKDSIEQHSKELYDQLKSGGLSSYEMWNTIKKYGTWAGEQIINQKYAETLAEQTQEADNGTGSGGSDSDKDKDNTSNRKNWVNLAICNKKEIPKLNVNLFKKPPNFTILNRNFKLRDVNVNTADDAKSIQNAVKNSIIEIQNRSNPKIIQDDAAEYDPLNATEGNTLPVGTKKTE